jgi:hypothetical protein
MTHQMASVAQFTDSIKLVTMVHKWNVNRITELQAIATALGSDTATHDTTMKSGPAQILQPGNAKNTKFTNDVLLIVNQGKAGNLTTAQMSAAITSGLAGFVPPVNTTAPAVTGTPSLGNNLTCSNGVWSGAPTAYTYQWLRGGAQIAGATSNVHAVVGADSGATLTCRVTAENKAGSTSALSNGVAVP